MLLLTGVDDKHVLKNNVTCSFRQCKVMSCEKDEKHETDVR